MSIDDWTNNRTDYEFSTIPPPHPFWCTNIADNPGYANRPDGRRVTHVCTGGVCYDYFDGKAQLVVTEGGVFHIHRVRHSNSPKEYRTVPIASREFGLDPDKDEVLGWVRMYVELGTLAPSSMLEKHFGGSRLT